MKDSMEKYQVKELDPIQQSFADKYYLDDLRYKNYRVRLSGRFSEYLTTINACCKPHLHSLIDESEIIISCVEI